MKKLRFLTFCLLISTLALAQGGTNFTYNGFNYLTSGSNDATCKNNSGATGAITIPATVVYNGNNRTVTKITNDCFANATITSLVLPPTITIIASNAFANCTALTSFTVNRTTPLLINSYVFSNINIANVTLYVPAGTLAAYQAAPVWQDFGTIIESPLQVLYNNGASLTLKTGGTLQVNGTAQFQDGSTLTNDGAIAITGNIINNQVVSTPNAGTLSFTGSAAQTLSGSGTYFAENVIVNNANGVTLNASLKVDGVFNFNNGIVTAANTANAVTFTSNATISGINAAKDASHIKGYVVKEGMGAFTYPVGNGMVYRPATASITANSNGLMAIYYQTEGGTRNYTLPLTSHNRAEYWDIQPHNSGTATATLTLPYGGNVAANSINTEYKSFFRLAHYTGGNWVAEGTTGGTANGTGTVTGNPVSTWSPFAIGTTDPVILPLKWLSVAGNINTQKQASINWQVQETHVANYIVEKSNDGSVYNAIATLISKGNGTNNYSVTEAAALSGTNFYRIKQTDVDGRSTYSVIIKLANLHNSTLGIYPNPVKDIVRISGATIGSKAMLTDVSGKLFLQITITQSAFSLDMSAYSSGVYLLKTDNGVTQKIIKE